MWALPTTSGCRNLSEFRECIVRSFVEGIVWSLVVVLALRTWCVQGVVIPCRVTGDSMLPGLRGEHYSVRCSDCGFRYDVDATHGRPAATICPNCENRQSDDPLPHSAWGDGVLVGRGAFFWRNPQRWERVVFRLPNDPQSSAIKRIVGLPGEEVLIRNGDVFIDGQPARKPYRVQRSLAVLVHDADFQPPDARFPPRWQGAERHSRWVGAFGRFARRATSPADAFDWLEYHHWRRVAGAEAAVVRQPICDDLYNHARTRREEESNLVFDLMLRFRVVEVFGSGMLAVRLNSGGDLFEVQIDPQQGRYRASHNGKALPGAEGRLPAVLSGSELWVSQVDQQFILAQDDCPLVQWPFAPADRSGQQAAAPVAIGAKGLGVVLEHLRLYRDVYYSRPLGADPQRDFEEPWKLGPDDYYVLGDNSLVSHDSRNWEGSPGVNRNLLLGKPFVLMYPMKTHRWRDWVFQVPELGRIEYIP